jgi:hypothetical protein
MDDHGAVADVRAQWLVTILVVTVQLLMKLLLVTFRAGTRIAVTVASSFIRGITMWIAHRRGAYTCSAQFVGHTGGIHRIAISSTGEYIASGGESPDSKLAIPQHSLTTGIRRRWLQALVTNNQSRNSNTRASRGNGSSFCYRVAYTL